ncbi:hypothetical protein BDA96_09G163100 [Sorghum bicolor]|uniref:Uncharacterized protein n=1 Tax=Sorghum bicolor TaxID=4558 RepID=A0A921QAT3_SORBI|nr:hypothetical protein BDA96_09G163100 [Sorghum bicolor]
MLLPLPEVVWYSILRVSSSSFLRSRLAFSIRFFYACFGGRRYILSNDYAVLQI